MLTRRHFVESLVAAGAAIPSLKHDGVERLRRRGRGGGGRTPADLADDEDFWREVQQAFTLDRTLINLNNGGVSPSPRVVQEAMRRYLEYSNTAPVYTMWQVLEPEIESVRRRLAASFGCDPEEMAITRNASEALEIVQLGILVAAVERDPELHDLERFARVAGDGHLLGVAPEARCEPAPHRLDLGLEDLPHRVRRRRIGIVEIAPHRFLHDARAGAHAAVVQVDDRAVERECLLDLAPEILVLRDVGGRAAVHAPRQPA